MRNDYRPFKTDMCLYRHRVNRLENLRNTFPEVILDSGCCRKIFINKVIISRNDGFWEVLEHQSNFSEMIFIKYCFHAFVTTLSEDLWSLKPAMIVTVFKFFGALFSTTLQMSINVAPVYECIVDLTWDGLIYFVLEVPSINFCENLGTFFVFNLLPVPCISK